MVTRMFIFVVGLALATAVTDTSRPTMDDELETLAQKLKQRQTQAVFDPVIGDVANGDMNGRWQSSESTDSTALRRLRRRLDPDIHSDAEYGDPQCKFDFCTGDVPLYTCSLDQCNITSLDLSTSVDDGAAMTGTLPAALGSLHITGDLYVLFFSADFVVCMLSWWGGGIALRCAGAPNWTFASLHRNFVCHTTLPIQHW